MNALDAGPTVPFDIVARLAAAELHSLWVAAQEDGAGRHHCPECCASCHAVDWLRRHAPTALAAGIVSVFGPGLSWIDHRERIDWVEITLTWAAVCPNAT